MKSSHLLMLMVLLALLQDTSSTKTKTMNKIRSKSKSKNKSKSKKLSSEEAKKAKEMITLLNSYMDPDGKPKPDGKAAAPMGAKSDSKGAAPAAKPAAGKPEETPMKDPRI